jgi:hypothetical protein
MERAISIVVYDPSDKEPTGTTFPPGSVWMADKERQERAVGQKPTVSPTNAPKKGMISSTGGFCSSMGITLKSLKAWDTEQLLYLAYRMSRNSTQEDRERFVTRLHKLLKKGMTDPDAIVDEAWRYGLQAIDSMSVKNGENGENASPAKKSPEVALQAVLSPKDRAKRFRAKRKGWSPERMSVFQQAKARQRSGKQTCFICKRPNTSPHHIIPRSEGGIASG